MRYFRGSVKDKLKRWYDACEEFGIKKFVSVDADDLFFDGELAQLSFETLGENSDFVAHPAKLPYEGCVGYSLTAEILKRAYDIKTSDDTEMIWLFLEKVHGLKKVILPVKLDEEAGPIRLTLDYHEDYWMLCTVLRILGPRAQRKDIEGLFKSNTDLHKINWFRNSEYKSLQEEKRI